MYKRYGKRLFDFIITLFLLLLFWPLILVLAIIIKKKLGSPILFQQQRPGLKGLPFTIIKFRTMTDERNCDGNLLSDAQRLTRFGRFLRSTSLDELPELINVLKGEMSFVGPRPLLMQYLPLYTQEQMGRHNVRPGITGWAQINGRNAISWEEKFELDTWYIENQSFLLDIYILWRTIGKTIARKDITQSGQATAEKFRGTLVNEQK